MRISHAGAVVYRDMDGERRYLVVTSSTGSHWVLPKGHLDPGELPEQAALRELREETGVIGEIVRPLSVQNYNRNDEPLAVQYFLVRAVGMDQAEEMRILRWEDGHDAFELLTFQEARTALREGAAAVSD
jgi:8-oxo-dGTP pyrophosphatase MutT (NUDIX family)